MTSQEDFALERFGRHVPRIVCSQIISQLMEQYVTPSPQLNTCPFFNENLNKQPENLPPPQDQQPPQRVEGRYSYSEEISPSIERFHAALLFVDISGFTVLSQRLNVDDLRFHINAYFKKILDIVHRFDGDVVKFAGDALFIIFHTPVHSLGDSQFKFEAKQAVQKAVACGLEINCQCSNYKIDLTPRNQQKDSDLYSMLMSPKAANSRQVTSPTAAATAAVKQHEESQQPLPQQESNITFLNVHSGVSVGMMAGMDIGSADRWEYVIMGQPMSDVAVAESLAAQGDLVISPTAHEFLCGGMAGSVTTSSATPVDTAVVDESASSDSSSSEEKGPSSQPQQQPQEYRQAVHYAKCGCEIIPTVHFHGDNGYVKVTYDKCPNIDAVNTDEADAHFDYELAICADVMDHAAVAHRKCQQLIKSRFKEELHHLQHCPLCKSAHSEHKSEQDMKILGMISEAAEEEKSAIEDRLYEQCDNHFFQWMQHCLVDDFARHVHEAERGNIRFRNDPRKGCIRATAELLFCGKEQLPAARQVRPTADQLPASAGSPSGAVATVRSPMSNKKMIGSNSNTGSPVAAQTTAAIEAAAAVTLAALGSTEADRNSNRSSHSFSMRSSASDSFVQKMRKISDTRQQKMSKNERNRRSDAGLSAELRSVIVLFINVRIPAAELLVDDRLAAATATTAAGAATSKADADVVHSTVEGFHFLSRTKREVAADKELLGRFQRSMEIIVASFKEKGGQMRQFIVDDKGTVCIGTFGLRGSVSNDNAAAAIDAAQSIIWHLHDVDVSASVGITSGKAYCGLVGYPYRHEYAVMGPSTNLSARLMGKAGPEQAICDEDTRQRDRSHRFITLSEVRAKGYAHLVPTFQPVLATRVSFSALNADSANGVTNAIADSIDAYDNAGALGINVQRQDSYMLEAQGEGNDLGYVISDLADAEQQLTVAKGQLSINHQLIENQLAAASYDAYLQSANDTPGGGIGSSNSSKNKSNLSVTPEALHLFDEMGRMEGSLKHFKGRIDEVKQVFRFLMPTTPGTDAAAAICDITAGTTTTTATAANSSDATKFLFDTVKPTVLAVLEGPSGIGKTSFMRCFAHRAKQLTRGNKAANAFVFSNKANSFNNSEPFSAWKFVIRGLLMQLCSYRKKTTVTTVAAEDDNQKSISATSNHSDTASVTSSATVSVATAKSRRMANTPLHRGLEAALPFVPSELHSYTSLLSTIQFIRGLTENATVNALSGANKLNKITELLAALIQAFILCTGQLAVVILDDLHAMDTASWELLRFIWQKNTGVCILASHMRLYSDEDVPKLLSSFTTDPDRFQLISLTTLSFDLIKSIAASIFLSHGICGVADFVFERLFEMSGGNPLFLYELTKAMMDFYLQSTEGKEFAKNQKHSELTATATDLEGDDVKCSMAAGLQLTEVVKEFRTSRIEEVIFFRFDQLDVATQLVLKLAAVVTANGDTFTLSMLEYMIEEELTSEDNGVHSTLRLATAASSTIPNIDSRNSSERYTIRSLVPATLKAILSKDEFVHVTKHRTPSFDMQSSKKSEFSVEQDDIHETVVAAVLRSQNNADLTALYSLRFAFKVRLEQRTIYDLMLDDQKAALHDRVASFLEEANSDTGFDCSAAEIFEEGFHWEHASCWSTAMSCYYRSAMILDGLGSYQDSYQHLTAAYRMLNKMRTEAGVNEDFQFVPASFQAIFSKRSTVTTPIAALASAPITPGSHGLDKQKSTVGAPSSTLQPLAIPGPTKQDIYRVFEGDSELLEVGLNVLLRLGQASFTLSDVPVVTSKLYEDALQLIMLTWNFESALHVGSSKFRHQPTAADVVASNSSTGAVQQHIQLQLQDGGAPSPLVGAKKSRMRKSFFVKHQNDISEDISDVQSFGLKDPSIVFPILSGIAALYRNRRLEDLPDRSKEATLYQLFLALARTLLSYRPHLLVGMCLYRTLLFELDRWQESIELADEIIRLYDHDAQADFLVKCYGNNRIPYTIMMHVQLLRMQGCFTKANAVQGKIISVLPRMTHLHSIAIVIYPLVSNLMAHGCKFTARKHFRNYAEMERERGGFSFFRPTNPLFGEWIELACLNEEFSKTNSAEGYLQHMKSCATAQKVEADILSKEYLPQSAEKRSILYSSLMEFGISAEHVCACVLSLKAKFTAKRTDISDSEKMKLRIKYLKLSIEYDNFSRDCSGDANRLAYNIFGTYAVLAYSNMYLADLESSEVAEEVTLQRRKEANDMLDKCLHLGRRCNFHLLVLMSGVHREVLGLDAEQGKKLQVEALDLIQEFNGPIPFAKAFNAVVDVFPLLERYRAEYEKPLEFMKSADKTDAMEELAAAGTSELIMEAESRAEMALEMATAGAVVE